MYTFKCGCVVLHYTVVWFGSYLQYGDAQRTASVNVARERNH